MAEHKDTPRAPYYAHIVGWGMAVPERVMTNDDISTFVETTNDWIVARTGIRERRIASESESTMTLGAKAALAALQMGNLHASLVDLIVCATSTPECVFPSTASLIQSEIGADNAGAFDLSAACSGFVYALQMASQSIRTGAIDTALVIGAETMSRVLDWSDRGTCILFGDGAGAVLLQRSEQPGGVLSAILRSEGKNAKFLGIPNFGSHDLELHHEAIDGHKLGKMYMDGQEVFKFATRVLSDGIKRAATDAGVRLSDIRLIVPHQANLRIIDAAARQLGFDKSMFYTNLDRYGNTSAASIPLALVEAEREGRIKRGDHVAFIGFGGGLTWAASVVQWTGAGAVPRRMGPLQQLEQLQASAASSLRRLRRRYGSLLNRIRPEEGRVDRLRRRMDKIEDLE
ncbi:MAG: ketoacyl-ACP synthase III [Anaerolineae bacterium]|jgi:3-oxoacyl-[acyl-carrier-protein] synthase-3|nr:ketoacyl-ACP synthase III [Anaerolineae bacterium]